MNWDQTNTLNVIIFFKLAYIYSVQAAGLQTAERVQIVEYHNYRPGWKIPPIIFEQQRNCRCTSSKSVVYLKVEPGKWAMLGHMQVFVVISYFHVIHNIYMCNESLVWPWIFATSSLQNKTHTHSTALGVIAEHTWYLVEYTSSSNACVSSGSSR